MGKYLSAEEIERLQIGMGADGYPIALRDLYEPYLTMLRRAVIQAKQVEAVKETVDSINKDIDESGLSLVQYLRQHKTQAFKVKEWLKKHGEIGLKESLFEDNGIGSARLAAIIHVLRNRERMNIKTKWVYTGKRKRVGRYILYKGDWDGIIEEAKAATPQKPQEDLFTGPTVPVA
ncbi:Uncharacterised protein [uncultured archaeon]|nr:Uncharacterised protein [uncultured archaeon]